MTTALAQQGDGYTNEQVELIRRTLCQDATPDELQMFIGQARRTGLDPFSKQIHAVKRGGKMTIQVGIDGLRLIAQRTGMVDGQDGPYWCGADGVWKDVWLCDTSPVACKVVVFRKGESRGYAGVAHMPEYYTKIGGMWDKLPVTMIAKVAETIALRKAFPQELSGLYAAEEMDKADDPPTAPRTQSPPQRPATQAQPAPKQLPSAKPAPAAAEWEPHPDDVDALAASKDLFKAEFLKTGWAWKGFIEWACKEFDHHYDADAGWDLIAEEHRQFIAASVLKELHSRAANSKP